MSLDDARAEIVDAAVRREDHAAELEATAAGLDADGYGEHAGRARARVLTLREAAGRFREIAGRGPLCRWQHEHETRQDGEAA